MPVSKRTPYERLLDKNLDPNTVAKSLEYFVFREVIEDVHAKYKITGRNDGDEQKSGKPRRRIS